jgi:hypothetical protein
MYPRYDEAGYILELDDDAVWQNMWAWRLAAVAMRFLRDAYADQVDETFAGLLLPGEQRLRNRTLPSIEIIDTDTLVTVPTLLNLPPTAGSRGGDAASTTRSAWGVATQYSMVDGSSDITLSESDGVSPPDSPRAAPTPEHPSGTTAQGEQNGRWDHLLEQIERTVDLEYSSGPPSPVDPNGVVRVGPTVWDPSWGPPPPTAGYHPRNWTIPRFGVAREERATGLVWGDGPDGPAAAGRTPAEPPMDPLSAMRPEFRISRENDPQRTYFLWFVEAQNNAPQSPLARQWLSEEGAGEPGVVEWPRRERTRWNGPLSWRPCPHMGELPPALELHPAGAVLLAPPFRTGTVLEQAVSIAQALEPALTARHLASSYETLRNDWTRRFDAGPGGAAAPSAPPPTTATTAATSAPLPPSSIDIRTSEATAAAGAGVIYDHRGGDGRVTGPQARGPVGPAPTPGPPPGVPSGAPPRGWQGVAGGMPAPP